MCVCEGSIQNSTLSCTVVGRHDSRAIISYCLTYWDSFNSKISKENKIMSSCGINIGLYTLSTEAHKITRMRRWICKCNTKLILVTLDMVN